MLVAGACPAIDRHCAEASMQTLLGTARLLHVGAEDIMVTHVLALDVFLRRCLLDNSSSLNIHSCLHIAVEIGRDEIFPKSAALNNSGTVYKFLF